MLLKIKEIKEIIAIAVINRILIYDSEKLSPSEMSALLRKADINKIPDTVLSLCEDLHPFIDWSKIDKLKVVRAIARNKNIIQYVKSSDLNLTLKDIIPCVKMHPELVHEFGIDFSKISKNEIVELLKTGREYFVEFVNYDFNSFSATEAFYIIKNFNFNPMLIEKMNLKDKTLNSQYLRDIIINTGEQFINDFDLSILEPIDWINILRSDKSLLRFCNADIFKRGDIFFLIEFILLFPEFKTWINEENKHKITCLGWEKLLIKFGDEFADLCDFSILTDVSWLKISNERPALMVYKL